MYHLLLPNVLFTELLYLHYNLIIILFKDLANRFKDKKPEDIAGRLGDHIAHRNGDIRSQIEELQRRNLEEMKELHK